MSKNRRLQIGPRWVWQWNLGANLWESSTLTTQQSGRNKEGKNKLLFLLQKSDKAMKYFWSCSGLFCGISKSLVLVGNLKSQFRWFLVHNCWCNLISSGKSLFIIVNVIWPGGGEQSSGPSVGLQQGEGGGGHVGQGAVQHPRRERDLEDGGQQDVHYWIWRRLGPWDITHPQLFTFPCVNNHVVKGQSLSPWWRSCSHKLSLSSPCSLWSENISPRRRSSGG